MRDLPQPPTLLPGGKAPGQILVVETIVYSRHDTQPEAHEARYSRWLKTAESPFVDELTANSEWQQVQTGRLRGIGLMILQNLSGADLQVVPTAEERLHLQSLAVQIAFDYNPNER